MPSLLSLTLASICVGFCRPITAATRVVGQSCRTAKAAGGCIENGRPRRDNFRACHCLSRLRSYARTGFGKSSGVLMIHQTFETTLRETDPRMESADDDLF
jgi:hypothetical protein